MQSSLSLGGASKAGGSVAFPGKERKHNLLLFIHACAFEDVSKGVCALKLLKDMPEWQHLVHWHCFMGSLEEYHEWPPSKIW